MLLFDDNKQKLARKPRKKQKEAKRRKGNMRERSRKGKTEAGMELSLDLKTEFQDGSRLTFS